MTTALKFLSQITNDLFERQMNRTATRISASRSFFAHHAG
jgi:hypothetical protein